MNAKDFVRSLWEKYFDKYEGPCKALRNEMCKFNVGGSEFNKVLGVQALIEKAGGESFLKCALDYPEIEYHLRTRIARQAFDELRHYQLLLDFLKEFDVEIERKVSGFYHAIYDKYYAIQTRRDFMSAMIGHAPEKNADNFIQELFRRTMNARLKQICHSITMDEKFHMTLLDEKLQLFSEDPDNRPAVERIFKEAWEISLQATMRLSAELGIAPEKVLAAGKS